MARPVLVLDMVLAMLQQLDAPPTLLDRFREHVAAYLQQRDQHDVAIETPAGHDDVIVTSGFGQSAQRGFVELIVNERSSQMSTAKAREIGLMLIAAAEAGESDEVFVKWLAQIGIIDPERRGRMLVDLREVRQGTRGTSRPS